jgi:hypothetical protein
MDIDDAQKSLSKAGKNIPSKDFWKLLAQYS